MGAKGNINWIGIIKSTWQLFLRVTIYCCLLHFTFKNSLLQATAKPFVFKFVSSPWCLTFLWFPPSKFWKFSTSLCWIRTLRGSISIWTLLGPIWTYNFTRLVGLILNCLGSNWIWTWIQTQQLGGIWVRSNKGRVWVYTHNTQKYSN